MAGPWRGVQHLVRSAAAVRAHRIRGPVGAGPARSDQLPAVRSRPHDFAASALVVHDVRDPDARYGDLRWLPGNAADAAGRYRRAGLACSVDLAVRSVG